jgi:hypothetical protein
MWRCVRTSCCGQLLRTRAGVLLALSAQLLSGNEETLTRNKNRTRSSYTVTVARAELQRYCICTRITSLEEELSARSTAVSYFNHSKCIEALFFSS